MTEISDPFTCTRCIVPAAGTNEALTNVSLVSTSSVDGLQLKNYWSFFTVFKVYFNVLNVVNKLKCHVNKRLAERIMVYDESALHKNTWNLLIRADQSANYSDGVQLFQGKKFRVQKRYIPCGQMVEFKYDWRKYSEGPEQLR